MKAKIEMIYLQYRNNAAFSSVGNKMKLIYKWSLLFFLLAFMGSVQAQAKGSLPQDPYKHLFNETWGDFSEELVNAQKQGKKGIMFFSVNLFM